jgi:hypothetical protein
MGAHLDGVDLQTRLDIQLVRREGVRGDQPMGRLSLTPYFGESPPAMGVPVVRAAPVAEPEGAQLWVQVLRAEGLPVVDPNGQTPAVQVRGQAADACVCASRRAGVRRQVSLDGGSAATSLSTRACEDSETAPVWEQWLGPFAAAGAAFVRFDVREEDMVKDVHIGSASVRPAALVDSPVGSAGSASSASGLAAHEASHRARSPCGWSSPRPAPRWRASERPAACSSPRGACCPASPRP